MGTGGEKRRAENSSLFPVKIAPGKGKDCQVGRGEKWIVRGPMRGGQILRFPLREEGRP